jgi:hypothetical protein
MYLLLAVPVDPPYHLADARQEGGQTQVTVSQLWEDLYIRKLTTADSCSEIAAF